jgi:hypothetical protein
MIKSWISATNPKMPSDKKPARKKLKKSSKPESKSIFVTRELYTQQSRNQIKNINITHFVRNSHDARQGHPWGFAPQPSRVVGLRFASYFACLMPASISISSN